MISQSVGALAVLSMLSTSVALANPTATVPANTTTTTATASSVAPATSTTATDASAADAADVAQGGPLADVPAGPYYGGGSLSGEPRRVPVGAGRA